MLQWVQVRNKNTGFTVLDTDVWGPDGKQVWGNHWNSGGLNLSTDNCLIILWVESTTMSANTKCWPLAESLATPEGMSIWMGTCDISAWVMTFGLVCSASVEWEMWRYRVTGENLTVWGQCSEDTAPSSYQIQPLCLLSGPSLKETDTKESGISFTGPVPSAPQCSTFWWSWGEAQAEAVYLWL